MDWSVKRENPWRGATVKNPWSKVVSVLINNPLQETVRNFLKIRNGGQSE